MGTAVAISAPIGFNYSSDYSPAAPVYGTLTPLTFGSAIISLAAATAHTSGGQFNPAVSIGLFAAGALGPVQMVANVLAQLAGSLVGTSLLLLAIPNATDAPSMGANVLADGVGPWNAFCGETVMTYALMFVVLETTVNKKSRMGPYAVIPIGLTILIGNAMLIPLDGAGINPARSFGPALLSGKWDDFWVFVTGPILGSLLAVLTHFGLREKVEGDGIGRGLPC